MVTLPPETVILEAKAVPLTIKFPVELLTRLPTTLAFATERNPPAVFSILPLIVPPVTAMIPAEVKFTLPPTFTFSRITAVPEIFRFPVTVPPEILQYPGTLTLPVRVLPFRSTNLLSPTERDVSLSVMS